MAELYADSAKPYGPNVARYDYWHRPKPVKHEVPSIVSIEDRLKRQDISFRESCFSLLTNAE